MKKNDTIKKDGTVLEALPNTMFKIELDEGGLVLATLRGVLRRSYVRIFPGDRVKVEMTKYDQERGRIVFKYRN
jgi:translation initiation factor IF-1